MHTLQLKNTRKLDFGNSSYKREIRNGRYWTIRDRIKLTKAIRCDAVTFPKSTNSHLAKTLLLFRLRVTN